MKNQNAKVKVNQIIIIPTLATKNKRKSLTSQKPINNKNKISGRDNLHKIHINHDFLLCKFCLTSKIQKMVFGNSQFCPIFI